MELTKIKPSKLVGKIKEEVENYIIDNDVDYENQEKIDELIMNVYKEIHNGNNM